MLILCLGDISGKGGRNIVKEFLSQEKDKYDLIIVNGENAAGGFGITPKIADELFDLGVDVITTGNHIWNKREVYEYLNKNDRLLRPANYPASNPGKGMVKLQAKNGESVVVINIQGNIFMPPIELAFPKAADLIAEAQLFSNNIIVDFHAEATSEKYAMGYFLDGKASLVYGTHTHVQTNDPTILPKGTGYLTDIGMCGSHGGIIGMKKESVLPKFISSMPSKFETAEGKERVNGLVAEIKDGRCTKIELINRGDLI